MSCLSPTDYPEDWPDPAPSKGCWKQPGLGPFLRFQPAPEDPLPEPFAITSPEYIRAHPGERTAVGLLGPDPNQTEGPDSEFGPRPP